MVVCFFSSFSGFLFLSSNLLTFLRSYFRSFVLLSVLLPCVLSVFCVGLFFFFFFF